MESRGATDRPGRQTLQELNSTLNLRSVLERAVSNSVTGAKNRPVEWLPTYDVRHTSKETFIYVDLPGMDGKNINIECVDQMVIVSGVREFVQEQQFEEEFTRVGRSYGEFRCEIPLPFNANASKTSAKYRRGVLRLRVPIKPRVNRAAISQEM